MNLQTAFNAIVPYNPTSSYQTFKKIVDNAEVQVSFWQDYEIIVKGYEGKILLNNLCLKVEELIDSHPEFSIPEREIGKHIEKRLQVLCDDGDKQSLSFSKLHRLFLNLFYTIKAIFFHHHINDDCEVEGLYRYGTYNQYKEINGKAPPDKHHGHFRKDTDKIQTWQISYKETGK